MGEQNEQKKNVPQQQDVNSLLKVRRDKLAELQAAGKDPFVITKYDQTHHTVDAVKLYEEHEKEKLAGRQAVNTEGLSEEEARAAVKQDYNEKREIMENI